MAKKLTAYALIILLLTTIFLTGCGSSNVIDSKIRTVVGGTSRSDEAVEWLIANKEMIIPELLNRVSNSTPRKSKQAAQALVAMGGIGRSGAIKLFDTMSVAGRNMWCTVIAEQKDKQSVIELLIISSHEGAFDMAVSALLSMGDVALGYLAGQLHSPYYQQTVDTVLANFGEKAVDVIIPAVHSTDISKVNRALVILATMGEGAAAALAVDALDNANNAEEAKQIAGIMLKNYPQTSIIAVMSAIDQDTRSDIAASLLYEISGGENISLVLANSSLGEAQKTVQILKQYVMLCGIQPILNLALGSDQAAQEGAEKALSGGEYDRDVVSAILSSVTSGDGADSKIDSLAIKLINDANMEALAHAVIASDSAMFAQLASGAMPANKIGAILSSAAHNPEIYNRMAAMIQHLESDAKKNAMTALASCLDEFLPSIVLAVYAGGEQNGDLAAQALTSAASASGKFLFSDVDMMPYASKIIEGLSSSDSTQKSYAQIILSRISTSKSTNEFYKTIFQSYKDKTIFSILGGHYGGAGALPLDLSIEAGGAQIVPKTVSLKKEGDIKNVSSSKEPDFNALITGFAPYLGWSQVESAAELELRFDCDITPHSKRYSGLIASSYLGAEATGTLTAYVNGEKVKTSTGYALILPPEEYPGPSGEFRYMSDPENAPSSEVYVICFINAMYNMWGEKALFGLYNFDINSTNKASEKLFAN